MDFTIKKRDAKTGNKKERTVAKLSAQQLQGGAWTRGAGGSARRGSAAYHFFIDGVSVCGRKQMVSGLAEGNIRKLCADCFAAVNRASQAEAFGL